MLNPAVRVTKGATDAVSGVRRQVSSSWSSLGATNFQMGIGYGVGFGHGFGVGLCMGSGVSGVLNQVRSFLVVTMTKMAMKYGLTPPRLPFSQGGFPASTKSAVSTVNNNQISAGGIMQLATKSARQVPQGLAGSQHLQIGSAFQSAAPKNNAVDSASGSASEKVISDFPKNPLLKQEGGLDEAAGRMHSENKMLQTVLKQKKIIEELVEENEKLRQILLEDQKVSSNGLQPISSGTSPIPKGENDSNKE